MNIKESLIFDKNIMSSSVRVSSVCVKHAFFSAILSVICFILIFLFSDRLPYIGNKQFAWSDALYSTGNLFRRNFLSGDSLEYSFSIGMGMESFLWSSFPFSLLNLLTDDLDMQVFLGAIARIMLSAALFDVFLEYLYCKNDKKFVAVSVIYALSAYTIGFYMVTEYINALYFMPLIGFGIVRYLRTGKWMLLSLIYAHTFATFFYLSYITGISSCLMFVGYLIYKNGKDLKKSVRVCITYAISVLMGVALAMYVLLPTFMYIRSNDLINATVKNFWFVHPLSFLSNLCIGQYRGMDNPVPMIYCGIAMIFLFISFFMSKGLDKKIKMLLVGFLVFLLLCTWLRPFYRFIQCGAEPNSFGFRFSFLFIFIICVVAAYEVSHGFEMKHLPVVTALVMVFYPLGMLVQYKMFSKSMQTMNLTGMIINLIMILIWGIVIGNKDKKWFKYAFSCMIIFEVILNGVMMADRMGNSALEDRTNYNLWQMKGKQSAKRVAELATEDGELFYRVKDSFSVTQNQGTQFGYNIISYFNNMNNQQHEIALEDLGYAGSYRLFFDEGGTPFTEMILAEKYEIFPGYRPDTDPAEYLVKRMEHPLSVGFMVGRSIVDYKPVDDRNVFENNNQLASFMTGKDYRIFIPLAEITGDAPVEMMDDGMQLMVDEDGYYLHSDAEVEGGSLKIIIPDSGLDMYAYFSQKESKNISDTPWVYSVGGSTPKMSFIPNLAMPYIIKIGKNENGENNIFLKMKSDRNFEDYTFDDLYIYCFDEAAVDAIWEQLSDSQLSVTEKKDNLIAGNITVDNDEDLLFLSVPYSTYWKAYVDGEETEIIPVIENGFMAIHPGVGSHSIRIVFHDPWLRKGLCISCITSCVLFLIWIGSKKRKAVSFDAEEKYNT